MLSPKCYCVRKRVKNVLFCPPLDLVVQIYIKKIKKKITLIQRAGFHDKSAQTDRSKEMWGPILKGLKHLNTSTHGNFTPLEIHSIVGPFF